MDQKKQIESLETGKGIQHLLDAAHTIFSNPIVMFDTHYTLIAYTDVVTDDPLWNEIISTGTFSMTNQEFFSKERFTEDVANTDKAVIITSDKLKYDRIVGIVFNNEHIKVANLVMVASNKSFETESLVNFEAFVDKISEEIRNDDHFTAFGRAYHDSIINKILDHKLTDPKIYTGHVQILYDGFEDYLYLAVVDVTNRDRLEYFKDLFKKRYPVFKFAVYSGYLLMIMSSKHNKFPSEWIFGDYQNPFEQNNLFMGVSSSFENLYELGKYYDEALTTLQTGLAEIGKGQHIFIYDHT
jgi:hypothetical protein